MPVKPKVDTTHNRQTKARVRATAKKQPLSNAQKRRRIDAQAKRVREADAAAIKNLWKRADELAQLAQVYKECHKRPPSAKKMEELTQINLDGNRQLLHARLSKYFPEEHRVHGVGMRVYEEAYKFNRAQKRSGGKQLTVEDLVAEMEPGRPAGYTLDNLRHKARKPLDEAIADAKAQRNLVQKAPRSVRLNKKRWLKAIETDPSSAIAAAIVSYEDESHRAISNINNMLNQLGTKLRLTHYTDNIQIDLIDGQTSSAA